MIPLLLLSLVVPQATFEAATVKVNKSSPLPAAAGGRGGSLRVAGSALVGENVTLWKCIATAYNASEDKDYSIVGPDWLKTERYDIVAKLPADRPRSLAPMFQALLVERFQLVVHRESKVVPGYALVVAKNGFKLKEVEPGPNRTESGNGMFNAEKTSMPRLAEFVARFAGRPVEDHTGIKGVFDVKLEWTPDDNQPTADGGPSIFTALQEQLGLKLESSKLTVSVIVVDHAEKVPTAN